MNKKKQLIEIIKQATALLQEHSNTTYNQQDIVDRLEWINCKVSFPFFNRVIRHDKGSLPYLKKIRDGLEIIISSELGYHYDTDSKAFVFSNEPDFEPRRITPAGEISADITQTIPVKVYPDGRLSLAEKVNFFMNAKKEVIFFGVRLKQLATYFTGIKEKDFKEHIYTLLARGVHIKCYMLDPLWEQSSTYFEDRSIELDREKRSLQEMEYILEDLKSVIEQSRQQELAGKFSLFTYRHFPQGYYLIVDGETEQATMHFAPYLFGLSRSQSPVQEISLREQPLLFDKYWESFKKLVSKAVSQ
ncbi:MAG: hypothetical protein AAGG68_15935 [Bacteroidota bacterium]